PGRTQSATALDGYDTSSPCRWRDRASAAPALRLAGRSQCTSRSALPPTRPPRCPGISRGSAFSKPPPDRRRTCRLRKEPRQWISNFGFRISAVNCPRRGSSSTLLQSGDRNPKSGNQRQWKHSMKFDPTAYGPVVAALLALDGDGERLMPLASGRCSSPQ